MMKKIVAAAILAAFLPAPAETWAAGQDYEAILKDKTAQIAAIKSQQQMIRDILKATEDRENYIFWGIGEDSSLQLRFPTVISKDDLARMLAIQILLGHMTPADASGVAAKMRSLTGRARYRLEQELIELDDRLKQIGPVDRPITSAARAVGYWRLKDGYPKLNPKNIDWGDPAKWGRNRRIEVDISDGSVTVTETQLHAETREVLVEFTFTINIGGVKTTMDPEEVFNVNMDGSWTFLKDRGNYNSADAPLELTGFSILKVDPPPPGPTPSSTKARIRLGRWTGKSGGDFMSDLRTVELQAPKSGGECVMDFGVLNYGPMIEWRWEWVRY